MTIRRYILDGILTGFVTFIVAALVTYLYNLIQHGNGIVNWQTAFILSIIFAIILPLSLKTGSSPHKS